MNKCKNCLYHEWCKYPESRGKNNLSCFTSRKNIVWKENK